MEENKEKLVPEEETKETTGEEIENSEENGNNEATDQEIEIKKERERRMQEFILALREGKGIFKLNTPIISGDEEITELPYDFTSLTGLEYTDAMDSDIRARDLQKITYRQGLALFATAAAKYSERLDMHDIVERIGAADAVEAVEIASLFFVASARTGHLRISRKS